ncbi:hypothetical protein MIZ01_0286 [Sideroxyarcus emersonii]|uniref:Uncharacterized protein n=1 Tax=Sideroxyarcus emersonii TaxID=2764705 RepID=A0AAN1X889_9PROT|nr:hypothetical protein [Sideroxyarcus emersonii]BCK86524.1 hypothetical protein MIZ01_0286 [Sideroxyarcus emersonii]
MSAAIVLDKSFLQGAKRLRIHELAASHRLVVSDALFYELLTASEPDRSRCFAKFPPIDNPVDLVNHIGTLMRIEIDTHQPAGKPSSHRESLRFQFNSRLQNTNYELPVEVQQMVDEQTNDLRLHVDQFVGRAATANSFFPNLLVGNQAERTKARDDAERAIAEPGSLINLYSNLEPPPGERPLPPSSLVTEDWALYRWLQVQFLFGLDLYVRYQGNIPSKFSSAIYEKLEHDVLDAEVLMLGCLEGAFATRENKLKRWWRLLCPNGTLYE